MYKKSSDSFNNLIQQAGGRTFYPKLECSSFSITSGIKKITYTGGSNSESGITVGSAVSAYIEVTMEKTEHVITGQEFTFSLGLQIEEEKEYVPMGLFKANKPEVTDYDITFKAYDRMSNLEKNYVSDLSYPTDTVSVMNEIASKSGITFANSTLSPITLNNPSTDESASNTAFAGYTMREAVGYIAGLYGMFAVINRDGELEFKTYEDSGYTVPISKTYDFIRNESDYTVNKVVGIAENDTTYTSGGGNTGISFSNPFVTQDITDSIYERFNGFTYRGAEIKFLGDCRIDVWDIITGTDIFGNEYKIPVMEITHEIDGGLTTTVKAESTDDEDVSDKYQGPTTKALERTNAELLLVNSLVATKASIEYLEANYISADKMDVIEANIENAIITNISATYATIETLKSDYATINSLNATDARVGTLEANALTAGSAVIQTLQSGVADINTLIFGSATGDVIQTEFANAVIAQLGNAQIKSAMIDEISANKVTSGTLNTNKVDITSNSGNMVISDNTIQISDGTNVRVQIGKDAENDYSINIWDSDGNLMFSEGGITDSAIKTAIIRNDMVSDTANISAAKLDIGSLFDVINTDGSHTLSSNKIYVNADGQTLDVAFQNLTDKTDGNSEQISTQGTEISAIQGQISSKIWKQDITTAVDNLSKETIEDESGNLLTDENGEQLYSFSATLVEFADETDKNFSEISTQYSELTQDLNGFKSVVSSTYATQDSVNNDIDNLQSQIDGAIETWFGSETPTLDNYPANEWTDDKTKNIHVGDLYYVQSEDSEEQGFCYRFQHSNGEYYWQLLKDNEVTKAIQDAAEAMAKANSVADDLLQNYTNTADMTSAISSGVKEAVSTASSDATTKANQAKADAIADTVSRLKSYSTTEDVGSMISQTSTDIKSEVSATYTTKLEFASLSVGTANKINGSKVLSLATAYEVLRDENGELLIDQNSQQIYAIIL